MTLGLIMRQNSPLEHWTSDEQLATQECKLSQMNVEIISQVVNILLIPLQTPLVEQHNHTVNNSFAKYFHPPSLVPTTSFQCPNLHHTPHKYIFWATQPAAQCSTSTPTHLHFLHSKYWTKKSPHSPLPHTPTPGLSTVAQMSSNRSSRWYCGTNDTIYFSVSWSFYNCPLF